MLFSRVLALPPRPLQLAQALADRPESFLLLDGTGRSVSYLGCDPIAMCEGLDPEPEAPAVMRGDLGSAPRWLGLLPYEATRGLERSAPGGTVDTRAKPHVHSACWWRFGAVVEISNVVRVIGDEPACVSDLCRLLMRPVWLGEPSLALAEAPEPRERHRERVQRALELIRAGQIYQVNLARRFRLAVRGHPLAVLASLGERQRFPYCAAMRLGELDVVSTSPELFLKSGPRGRLLTAPIKGTRPRGADAVRDRAEREALAMSEKEVAELTMILDVERNDLGKVARTGTVRLLQRPAVTSYPTLHHRAALLGALIRPDCGIEELLRAMLPSGSVTGAPKVRAMQVIAEFEAERRGLYTGAFGILSHARDLTLAMAIRTLTVRQGEGHYFSGGGIVADSHPDQELSETDWKTLQLLRLGR